MRHLLAGLPALLCLLATLAAYLGAKRLYARLGRWWSAPWCWRRPC